VFLRLKIQKRGFLGSFFLFIFMKIPLTDRQQTLFLPRFAFKSYKITRTMKSRSTLAFSPMETANASLAVSTWVMAILGLIVRFSNISDSSLSSFTFASICRLSFHKRRRRGFLNRPTNG
jgi:hypothetical protein